MQHSNTSAWAMELSLSSGMAREGGSSDLSCCWALSQLWWMSIHWVWLILLEGKWLVLPGWHSPHDTYCTQKMRPMDWNKSSYAMPRHGSCMYYQSFRVSTKDTGSVMTTVQRLFWAFAYSHPFEPQIICSFKTLCLYCCIPEETGPPNDYYASCVPIELQFCQHQDTQSSWVFHSSHHFSK